MAVKLSSLKLATKIPKWVHLSAHVSSISCANNIQILPENDQNQLSNTEFEVKIQFLKNKLHPDSLIRVLDSTDDLNSSLKLFKWASLQNRFRHTVDSYYKIIWKLGMAGNIEEMEVFCNEMVKERFPCAEEALLALVDSFVKHGRLDEALRVLRATNFGNYRPSVGVFNVLLGALVEEKRDFPCVLFVYKEMVKAGIVPTTETLNYLLEALFESGRVETALDQYRRMNKKGCVPNSKTFEVLINGLIAENRVNESIVVLGEMLELGVEPGLSFYTNTIPLFCKENKLEEGIKLLRMMRASKIVPDSFIYEVVIESLCENLRVIDAISLLEEMLENSLSPSDDVFVNILNGFCKLGKFSEATCFLEDKLVSGTCPHNALLQGYCNANNFLMAKDLFDKMFERKITDTDSWNFVIRWLSENARIDKALEYLCRMIVSSFAPNSATYSALVIGKCKSSELDDALELFHKVCAKSWVLDSLSYAELVEHLCLGDKIQEAAEVFLYMSTHKSPLRSSSFNVLTRGLCGEGEVDRAITLLPLAYSLGTSCSTSIYNTMMLGLSKSEKTSEILVLLSRMLVEGCTLDVETYCILIESMSLLGRTKDCALFFNLMVSEDLLPDSRTLSGFLSCLAKHSQLNVILHAIDKLVSCNDVLNPEMYNILINGLLKEGNKSEACRLLDLMLEKGWVPDANTHGLLVGSMREEPDSEIADYEDLGPHDNVSSILAEALGKT